MTPLSAAAAAVGHLLSHSLSSVSQHPPFFPPPPFPSATPSARSSTHWQRRQRTCLLSCLLPAAGAVIFIMRNCRHIKWSPDDDSWQAARVACPIPCPACSTASAMGWTVNFKALANFHLSCPPCIVVASKHNESVAHRSIQYTQLGRWRGCMKRTRETTKLFGIHSVRHQF